MRIETKELSPFPGLISNRVTALCLSKREQQTIRAAMNIMEQADRILAEHYDELDHPYHVMLYTGDMEDAISGNAEFILD